jgi:hypothetical protein
VCVCLGSLLVPALGFFLRLVLVRFVLAAVLVVPVAVGVAFCPILVVLVHLGLAGSLGVLVPVVLVGLVVLLCPVLLVAAPVALFVVFVPFCLAVSSFLVVSLVFLVVPAHVLCGRLPVVVLRPFLVADLAVAPPSACFLLWSVLVVLVFASFPVSPVCVIVSPFVSPCVLPCLLSCSWLVWPCIFLCSHVLCRSILAS